MDAWIFFIVGRHHLRRLPFSRGRRLANPGRGPPSYISDRLGGSELKRRFLPSLCRRGKIPDLHLAVRATADDVFPIRVPVDCETWAIMGGDSHQRGVHLSIIPHLDRTAVRSSRKDDAVGGRPPDVSDGITIYLVRMLAAACGSSPIRRGGAQIPHSNCAILAPRQEPRRKMGVEGKLVNLTIMPLEAT